MARGPALTWPDWPPRTPTTTTRSSCGASLTRSKNLTCQRA